MTSSANTRIIYLGKHALTFVCIDRSVFTKATG
jgi:hypothetical protein